MQAERMRRLACLSIVLCTALACARENVTMRDGAAEAATEAKGGASETENVSAGGAMTSTSISTSTGGAASPSSGTGGAGAVIVVIAGTGGNVGTGWSGTGGQGGATGTGKIFGPDAQPDVKPAPWTPPEPRPYVPPVPDASWRQPFFACINASYRTGAFDYVNPLPNNPVDWYTTCNVSLVPDGKGSYTYDINKQGSELKRSLATCCGCKDGWFRPVEVPPTNKSDWDAVCTVDCGNSRILSDDYSLDMRPDSKLCNSDAGN